MEQRTLLEIGAAAVDLVSDVTVTGDPHSGGVGEGRRTS